MQRLREKNLEESIVSNSSTNGHDFSSLIIIFINPIPLFHVGSSNGDMSICFLFASLYGRTYFNKYIIQSTVNPLFPSPTSLIMSYVRHIYPHFYFVADSLVNGNFSKHNFVAKGAVSSTYILYA